jgi:hypothetical protein
MPYMVQYSSNGAYDHQLTEIGSNTRNNEETSEFIQLDKTVSKGKKKFSKRNEFELRRPLSAYNFFFSEERDVILALLPSPSKNDSMSCQTECDESSNNDKISSPDVDSAADIIGEMTVDQLQEFLSQRVLSPTKMEDLKRKTREKTQQILETQYEGDKVKKPHRKSHGKISFQKLASIIGRRWREKSKEEKQRYYDLAKLDLERFISKNPNGSRNG